MTAFHFQQPDCGRRVHKKANADTFNFASQIPPSTCAVMHTKHDKRDATIFKSPCKRTAVSKYFYRVEALPLVRTRFLRLANSSPKTARSPARRSRDGRATSGKKSGEISRAISAQRPGNGRTVATAMPLNVRQDDSQDNLPCAGLGRAMSAPGTGETTRNTSAQRPRQYLASNSSQSRRQLSTMTSKNYEHTNHATINARSRRTAQGDSRVSA
jgi:hypothetical protein